MVKKIEQENQVRRDFSERLQNARKMRGLSISELAKRLNGIVSSTAIEKYEKAIMFPQSGSIIIALAQVLQVPVGDLLRPITTKIDIEQFEFRKKSKLGKKAQDSILFAIKSRIEKYFDIEQITNITSDYTLGKSNSIIENESDARLAAMYVRNVWNLGTAPIASPILLLEDHGALVIEVREDPNLFDGTSCTINGKPIIVINGNNKDDSNPDEERRRITNFHEFGHQYLRFPKDMDDKMKEELCNVFANEMLMPSEVFKRVIGEYRDVIYVKEMKNLQQEYGISVRALMMKAKQLGIITGNYYKWFCIKLNKNLELKDIVDRNSTPQTHTSRFEQLVLKSLAQAVITESKAAELLGMTVSQLNNELNMS